MVNYLKLIETEALPRLPLKGSLDLTYRCNNNCRHCWLRIPEESPEKKGELTLNEIKEIVDEARKMGCREWFISGGEPMLRPDFEEIFDYITAKSISYTLNTNGTLITPRIARLLKRKGSKMIVLYGAAAEVHDHITRNPGSFEAALKGMTYLRKAKAEFIVQLIPMRDNFHQFQDMIRLAESLSPLWRIGTTWLYLSACGDPKRNREIRRQRLDPEEVIKLDLPDPDSEELMDDKGLHYLIPGKDDRLFAPCLAVRREFHVDPFGWMSFCGFIKDPSLRYDLRKGSFKECWEEYLPSLANKVRGGKNYLNNCGSCKLRSDCLWCPAYGYLEHRNFSAKVNYLCALAREKKKSRENWKKNHCRYFQIGGITIKVESDLPITAETFHRKFKQFEVRKPGEETVAIRHHFFLPRLKAGDLGKEVYRKPPWAICKKGNSWIYLGISPSKKDRRFYPVAVFNHGHTRGRIYNQEEQTFRQGNLSSLTLFPTDQILLARVLADRQGCYLHSSGVILREKGLIFAGHSEAGKSTLVKMLKGEAEILCDDRIIVREHPDGFRIHGTWSHGEIAEVSANSAPLRAILFLKKAEENSLLLLEDRQEIAKKLMACLIKPLITADWWEKSLTLLEKIAREIPCYSLNFDKSGKVVGLLKQLCLQNNPSAKPRAKREIY